MASYNDRYLFKISSGLWSLTELRMCGCQDSSGIAKQVAQYGRQTDSLLFAQLCLKVLTRVLDRSDQAASPTSRHHLRPGRTLHLPFHRCIPGCLGPGQRQQGHLSGEAPLHPTSAHPCSAGPLLRGGKAPGGPRHDRALEDGQVPEGWATCDCLHGWVNHQWGGCTEEAECSPRCTAD